MYKQSVSEQGKLQNLPHRSFGKMHGPGLLSWVGQAHGLVMTTTLQPYVSSADNVVLALSLTVTDL